MTDKQEQHLQRVKDVAVKSIDVKYRKGAAEHGGTLTSMSERELVDNALAEAIDQVVYLTTLRDKLDGQRPVSDRVGRVIKILAVTPQPCPKCNGEGLVDDDYDGYYDDCTRCDGTGEIESSEEIDLLRLLVALDELRTERTKYAQRGKDVNRADATVGSADTTDVA